MHQSEGKLKPVLRSNSSYFGIIKPVQILIGRFKNLSNKALIKSCMLEYFNVVNTKLVEFNK